jgi:pyruvate dehydrogenase E1 component alpha subunit
MYELMTQVRQCEERLRTLIMSGQIRIAIWLPWGQEAVAAGVAAALRPDDYVVTTYRGMHDQLAKGVALKPLWAEYLGKASGLCKGKGGPMHIADPASGLVAASGIVGGGIPIANGCALASKLRGDGKVTVCNFGDGASNIGGFHEALNLAALWRLPVIFLCQNNGYAEHTAASDSQVNAHVADRAAGYGMVGVTVDGNDPVAVFSAVDEAVARARNGAGPTLVEAVAYRFAGHYLGDMQSYVPEEWLAAAAAADPVPAFRARLLQTGDASEEDLQAIEKRVGAELDEAVAFAMSSPDPDPAELLRDVYVEEGIPA